MTMAKQLSSLIKVCVCGMMVLSGAVSCEKMNIEDEGEDLMDSNVVLHVGSIEQIPFGVATRATLEDICTRLNFHVYDDQGMRVDYVNQKLGDAGFGTASFLLDKGHYFLVVVAHNGSQNPSFKKEEIVSISGDNLGDTFWCSKDFEVGDDKVNLNLELQRIVAMLRFIPTVTPPEDLNKILIKYKGSKGTFNGLTGYGRQGNQTVSLFPNPEDRQYEFYMIPQTEEDEIDISFTGYNVDDNDVIIPLGGCSIDGVPMRRNSITICKGDLFNGDDNSASVFITVSIDDSWGDNIQINI